MTKEYHQYLRFVPGKGLNERKDLLELMKNYGELFGFLNFYFFSRAGRAVRRRIKPSTFPSVIVDEA